MKVSELAKELGYKSTELAVVAKRRGIDLADKSELPAQIVAVIKAKVPPASRLAGPDLEALKVVQDEMRREKEKKDEEKRRKEEEKARKEAERLAKKQAKEAKLKEREEKEKAKEAAKAPAPAPVTPPPVTHIDPRKVTRRKEIDITLALKQQEAKKREAEKFQAQVHGKLGREIVSEKPKRRASDPIVKVKDDEEDVRVMRPTEVERFGHESEKERVARAAAAAAKAKIKGAKVEAPKEKEKIKPKKHGAPAPQPPAAPAAPQGYTRPMRRLMPSAPAQPRPKAPAPNERRVRITPPIGVRDFSEQMGIKISDLMRKLMDMGLMPTVNTVLNQRQVEDLALQLDRNIEIVTVQTLEEKVTAQSEEVDDPKDLVQRPPIVTFMGHVDHGKTSLMDKIRQTNVAEKEFGGITQHVGAYRVKIPDGRWITFLDTPGHEAFTAMRSRGANVTDIAVIVVAADEGVMPQTEEAIDHARAADVTIMVAVNKVDKAQANIQRTKQQLASIDLNPEEWGGQTIMVEVSAMTGKNVPQLLEMIMLQAEVLDLKANPKRHASGTVLEAKKSEGKGVMATLLVQNGTLRKGDILLCGRFTGRVRAMFDEFGKPIDVVTPAMPVEVLGLEDVPEAGDKFQVVDSMAKAQEIAEERQDRNKAGVGPKGHMTLESLFEKMGKGLKEVKVILKADVKGSIEAIQNMLGDLMQNKEVQLKLIHVGVGAVSESDVLLADASDAIVMGFNVPTDDRARDLAKVRGVDIKTYNVIYELKDNLKAAMEGMLEPDRVEESIGRLEVKQLFKVSRLGTIAGCMVREGRVERTALVRVIRGNQIIHAGKIETLKRFKDDVKEVAQGYECGVKVKDFDNVQPGDQIEAYVIKEIARRLTETPRAKS